MLRYELIAKIIPALEEEAAKEKVPKEYDYMSGLVQSPTANKNIPQSTLFISRIPVHCRV
jgi:hypothetical protein